MTISRYVLFGMKKKRNGIIQSIPSPKAEPFKLWLAEASTTEITKTTNSKGGSCKEVNKPECKDMV